MDAETSESGQAELELYGVLSEYSWFGDEITPAKFKDDLYRVGKGGPVLMKVNSPGGDVFAASLMRTILTDYPGEVTARVDGLAASAAVGVTLAARRIQIMDAAYMMIHDPAVVVFLASLDIETLGHLHDSLVNIKDGLVQTYEARTGLSTTKISHLMSDETWMSARQAVELGFADEVISGGQKPADKVIQNMAVVNCLNGYNNTPLALLAACRPVEDDPATSTPLNVPEEAVSSEPRLTDDMQREAQTLRERVQTLLKGEKHA